MGHPLILFILVIKSYLQNMKKIEKSLEGATGNKLLYKKSMGFMGHYLDKTKKLC